MRPKAMLVLGILALAFCAFAAEVELFPFETFDSWATPPTPPTGWTRIVGGSEAPPVDNTNDWHQHNGSGTWSTRPVARIHWSPTETWDDWLITPTFNPTGATYDSIVLVYETDYSIYAPTTGDNTVSLSVDGGTTWTEVLYRYGASNPVSVHETRRVNITTLVAGHANCKIGFHAARYSFDDNWWEIDNVVVFGYTAPTEPEPPVFAYTCESLLPPGTTSHLFEVYISDFTGVNPSSVQLCYSINGAPESCVGMTYVTGAPDGIGDYTYNLGGLSDWDIIEYYFKATDTHSIPSSGNSATCNMIVSGNYYIYEDGSGMPLAPDPTWQNISLIGWNTGLWGFDIYGWATLPFTFRWYGVDYDTFWISDNGWLSFGDDPGDHYYTYYPLPSALGPLPNVGVWWEDYNTFSTGEIYWYISADNDTVIVQWDVVPRYTGGVTETFQAVIINPAIESHPGGNGSIICRYLTKNQNTGSLGICNDDGTVGVQYWYDGTMGSPDFLGFEAGRAIRYCTTPPPEGGELWGNVTLNGRTDHSGATVGIIGMSRTGTTDATGYYEITRIPPGTYDVWCHHPAFFGDTAYGVIIFEGVRTRKDFTLEPRPTGYIAGWADLTDTPGADAGIFCEAPGSGIDVLTDATGYFFFDGVDVGDNQVIASFPGYNYGWSPLVTVTPGETVWLDTIYLTPIDVEDFEDDDGGLIPTPLTGGWQWGTPSSGPAAAHSGVNCWATMLHTNYLDDVNWILDVEVPYPSDEFSWWQWLRSETGYDGGNIKVSTNGGITWEIATPLVTPYNTTLSAALNLHMGGEQAWAGTMTTWANQSIALTPDATHVRFHFSSDYVSLTYPGWYVDDIAFRGSPTGQLRVFVYDCNTYNTISGATVYAPGGMGVTGPDGSVILDNILYGEVPVRAGKPGYWPVTKNAIVFVDEMTSVLIPLCPIDIDEITGQIEHDTDDSILFELCNPTEDTIWYHFTGIPGAPGRMRPTRTEEPKIGFARDNNAKFAMSATPITDDIAPRERPSAVGEILDSFPIPECNLPWGFGIEGRTDINKVWVCDRHQIGTVITQVQNMAWTPSPWTYTGIIHDIGRIHWPAEAPNIAWFVDMAWDANRNVMWQLESYETFKLYAWDPITGMIVDSLGGPWTANYQRGVGYDFARDVFYIGSWFNDLMYAVKGPSWDVPGDIMDIYDAPGCAGIAFDPGRRTVWFAKSGAPSTIHEIDLGTGAIINTILAPHPELGDLAGLDMDYQGRLWVMNYSIPMIYVLEAPASVLPGGMFIEPNAGFIPPGECETFALVNPEYANPAGEYIFDIYLYTDDYIPPSQLPVTAQVLPDEPRGWNLIAVPIQAIPNSPFIQLRDDVVPFNMTPTGSNLWGWNQDHGIFDLPEGFQRGRGYFLQTWLAQTFWDVEGIPYAPGDFIYPVYYPEASPTGGLWLVGNPFNRRLDWDAVYAATDFTYLLPEYWTWSQLEGYKFYSPILGGGGEDNIIDSWRGYFINVLPGNPLVYTNIIYPQGGTMETFAAKAKSKAKVVKTATSNPEEFVLRVSTLATMGAADKRYDVYNYFSVNESALDAYEGPGGYDIEKPNFSNPGLPIKAFFENGAYRLARDTKQNFSDGTKSWTYVVRDLPAGMNVTISWPKDRVPTGDDASCGVDNLDRRWSLYLTDQTTGATVNMRDAYTYTFTSSSSPRRFTITLGDSPLNVEDRKLPEEFALSANRPNPFNATTEFMVALPMNSHVKVEVFDLLGQKVSTIVDGEMEAGYQRIIWNGRDTQDRDVPSGLYLYRVTAGDFNETRKMTLIK